MNKNKWQHLWGWLALLSLLFACTEEASIPIQDDGSQGCVTFSFSVGNSGISRAEEPGWSNWNENTVEKVDMFIFSDDGATPKYFSSTSPDAALLKISDGNYTWQPEGLTRDDIKEGDKIYVIANCDVSNWESVTSIDALKAIRITGGFTNPAGMQDKFLMDGYKQIATTDLESNLITIDLKRAAAKIRLTFSDDSEANWSNISYCLCQYATTSTVLDLEDDSYLTDAGITSYPRETDEADVIQVNEDDLYTTSNSKKYLVFYSYANDWFDTNKLGGSSSNWTITDYASEEPIIADKQTYILLKAPYGGEEYYYKIPVNFRLYTDNDKVSFTDDELAEIRALYRLQRNYIYDITVTIDRAGGTEPKEPIELKPLYYHVDQWDEMDIEVPSFD